MKLVHWHLGPKARTVAHTCRWIDRHLDEVTGRHISRTAERRTIGLNFLGAQHAGMQVYEYQAHEYIGGIVTRMTSFQVCC